MPSKNALAEKEREQYVAISNRIIRYGHYDLTAQQLKIMLYIISKIKPDDDENTWYTIKIRELCRCCGINLQSGSYYKRLKSDLKKLTWRTWFSLPDGQGDWESSISWIGDVTISNHSGEIKLIFNPFMAPFLFHLKENYTQYELMRILTFSSKYSIRVYMLIKSFIYEDKLAKNIPQHVRLDLGQLRSTLVTKGYEDWRDFSKRVLMTALDEINEKSEELHIEVEPEKNDTTNKVEKLKFTITAASTEQADRAREFRDNYFSRQIT